MQRWEREIIRIIALRCARDSPPQVVTAIEEVLAFIRNECQPPADPPMAPVVQTDLPEVIRRSYELGETVDGLEKLFGVGGAEIGRIVQPVRVERWRRDGVWDAAWDAAWDEGQASHEQRTENVQDSQRRGLLDGA